MEQRERGACWQNADRLDEPSVRALPQGVCVCVCVCACVNPVSQNVSISSLVFTEEGMRPILSSDTFVGGLEVALKIEPTDKSY